MKRFLLLLVLFAIPLHFAFPIWETVPRYAGDFLKLGAGARALGMANSFIAVTDDPSVCYFNPAGLGTIQKKELFFLHSEQFGNLLNYDYLNFIMPLERVGGIGINLLRASVDGIKYTRDLQKVSGTSIFTQASIENISLFNFSDYALFFSIGRQWGTRFQAGGNLKTLLRYGRQGDYLGAGIGLDLGFLYQPWAFCVLGFSARDISMTPVFWNSRDRDLNTSAIQEWETTDKILPDLSAAVSLHHQWEQIQFLLTAQLEDLAASQGVEKSPYADHPHRYKLWQEPFKKLKTGAIGFEAGLEEVLFFRLGHNNIYPWTFGVGGKFFQYHLSLDYAFASHPELSNSHRLSLSYKF